MIKIEIRTDNEAFSEDKELEVSRILKRLANQIEVEGLDAIRSLLDYNGNIVGQMKQV